MGKESFVETSGTGGLQKITVCHESGASLEVYLKGASAVSWKDASGRENLYLSPESFFDLEHPIRGGIPLAFPQFGPGALPPHGFARLELWSLESTAHLPDGNVGITLTLADSDNTRKGWNHGFILEYTLILSEDALLTQGAVQNTGRDPFEFDFLFHTYFNLSDIFQTELRGFEEQQAEDRVGGGERTLPAKPFTFHASGKETNLIIQNNPASFILRDKTRCYKVSRSGNLRDTVLWNPWAETCIKGPDFANDSYRYFACVEPGAVTQKTRLVPGESAVFSQRIQACPPV
jgi:glucose-6-phosphate 1-epimerase